jgi:hypothetical protein
MRMRFMEEKVLTRPAWMGSGLTRRRETRKPVGLFFCEAVHDPVKASPLKAMAVTTGRFVKG